jgi:hypothetical protein
MPERVGELWSKALLDQDLPWVAAPAFSSCATEAAEAQGNGQVLRSVVSVKLVSALFDGMSAKLKS